MRRARRPKKSLRLPFVDGFANWASSVLDSILQEWAEIGIRPDDFETIVKEQVARLSARAEDWADALLSDWPFSIAPGRVLKAVRESVEFNIVLSRGRNSFLWASFGARTSNPSDSSSESKDAKVEGAPRRVEPSAEQPEKVADSASSAAMDRRQAVDVPEGRPTFYPIYRWMLILRPP